MQIHHSWSNQHLLSNDVTVCMPDMPFCPVFSLLKSLAHLCSTLQNHLNFPHGQLIRKLPIKHGSACPALCCTKTQSCETILAFYFVTQRTVTLEEGCTVQSSDSYKAWRDWHIQGCMPSIQTQCYDMTPQQNRDDALRTESS